jgi:membrane protein required for colicin V production
LVYTSGHLVTKVVNAVTLGMINRLAGATFGILANALILSVFIVLFGRINTDKQYIKNEKIEETYLYKPIGKVAPTIFPKLSKKFLE